MYDTLIRAGVKCTSALIASTDQPGDDQSQPATAQCSRGIRIVPDILQSQLSASSVVCLLSYCERRFNETLRRLQGEYDAIIVPGGAKGAETMSQSPFVQTLVKGFYDQGKYVGMICAGMILMRSWRWAALLRAFKQVALPRKLPTFHVSP